MRNLLKREQEFARELTSNRVERKATATPISDFQTMNNSKAVSKKLPIKQRDELLTALKERFEKNMNRHKGLDWAKVQARLEANAEKQWSLAEMERTGGEPDVVGGMHRERRWFSRSAAPLPPVCSACHSVLARFLCLVGRGVFRDFGTVP